jgi:hypothetical protein
MADGMDEAGTPTCGSPAAGQQVMTVAGLTHQSINPFPTKFPATFDRAFLCIGWRLAASPRNWRGGMKTAPDGMSSRAAMHVARTLTGESIPAASGRQGCGDKPGRDRGGARRFGKGFAGFVPAQRAARVRPAQRRAFGSSLCRPFPFFPGLGQQMPRARRRTDRSKKIILTTAPASAVIRAQEIRKRPAPVARGCLPWANSRKGGHGL